MGSNSVLARRVPVWGGLLLGAVGIFVQKAGGADYPTIPPGAIIFVVAALLVALLPWRWVPILGVLVGLFMAIGWASHMDTLARAWHPGDFLAFVGTWFQLIGVVSAFVFGIVLTFTRSRAPQVSVQS
jgi:hypothetical protein